MAGKIILHMQFSHNLYLVLSKPNAQTAVNTVIAKSKLIQAAASSLGCAYSPRTSSFVTQVEALGTLQLKNDITITWWPTEPRCFKLPSQNI